MYKRAYLKIMGLCKKAARTSLLKLLTPSYRQLAASLRNYSRLQRIASGAVPVSLLQKTLGGISQRFVDMSPFKYALKKYPQNAQKIAQQAFEQARISLSALNPLQIWNPRQRQLLGHIIQQGASPSILFNPSRVSSVQSMRGESLWAAVNSVLQRFYGKGVTMPRNTLADVTASTYRAYPGLPGTNMQAWQEAKLLKAKGLPIDYNQINAKLGNGVRFSNHFNPQGFWQYNNLVAPIQGSGGQSLFYNLPQTLKQLRTKGLIGKPVHVIGEQQMSPQTRSFIYNQLVDNFGAGKANSVLDDMLQNTQRVPFIDIVKGLK